MKKTILGLLFFIILFGHGFSWSEPTPYPTLNDKVNYEIKYRGITLCTFQDKPPFATVNLGHPDVVEIQKKFTDSIFKSAFSYWEWKAPYNLEKEDWKTLQEPYENGDEKKKQEINLILAETNFKNFMLVLCGEHRDFPAMLFQKIKVILRRTPVVPKGVMNNFKRDDNNIWQYFTGDAYEHLLQVTSTMYSYWVERRNENQNYSVVNYNFTDPLNGEIGDQGGLTNRTENTVPPLSHCQMKFIFETYLTPTKNEEGEETYKEVEGEEFDQLYAKYDKRYCLDDDRDLLYDFRGHKNFQPLWFDSNAMIWVSRLAARRYMAAKTPEEREKAKEYYLRPFATRYAATLALWGGYLFYPETHHEQFREASESGGGPQVYYHPSQYELEVNGGGLPKYRLSEWIGEGDTGLDSQAHPIDDVLALAVTEESFRGFTKGLFKEQDLGFLKLLSITESINGHSPEDLTFAYRMQRLNQAIDRHTNWGPTMMVAPDMKVIYSAYSPLVACSYMIDASHAFATSDYPTTHPDERGKTKWMYIMKFHRSNYYDEKALKAGKMPNWERDFLNEPGLSNDYYQERALNHVATIPPENIDASLYLANSSGDNWW